MSFFDRFRADPEPPEPSPPTPELSPDEITEIRANKNCYQRYLQKFPEDVEYNDLYSSKVKVGSLLLTKTPLHQTPKLFKFCNSILKKSAHQENELTEQSSHQLTPRERITLEADLDYIRLKQVNWQKELESLTHQPDWVSYCQFVCQTLLDHYLLQLQPSDVEHLNQLIANSTNANGTNIEDFKQTLKTILQTVPETPLEPEPDFNLGVRLHTDAYVVLLKDENQIHENVLTQAAYDPFYYWVWSGHDWVGNELTIADMDKKTLRLLTWVVLFENEHNRLPNEADWRDHLEDPAGLGANILQPQDLRDRHTYIIGKSGSGKTTLMLQMIYQDLKAGNGLGVIAPEQEMLTEQILPYIPEDRLEDVIYFNPADENPIPFNPLNLEPDEDADLKADEVMTIFKRIIGTEGTPRIDEILRQSIYALLTTPNTTILDIPKLLDRTDLDYRHQIISQLQDEYCAHFWRDTYPQFPKDAHLPVLYRIGAFTRDKRIRNTLCRTGQSLNFRQVMDTGKIVLFNLSDGILGEQNSQLLGQLIVSQFQLAVASRANIPEQQRKRFYLYIDEFQTFTNTAASSYEKILSRARKYRLALTLAHQQTGQIPGELLRDIFGNVSTMISFTVSHADATKLSKEFLTEQDGKLAPTPPEKFIELQIGETFCKLGRESFKMKTFQPTEQPNWDTKEKIIKQSRQQFTSDTPTRPADSKPKSSEPTPPDKPLGKPQIKPTGRIG